ncbi:hypothetical protein KJ765_06840 [Candidatus Micrarchaeota archaeon]|nr:hypothetical protein [Candidatus Micrarchaeota archaeon]
MLRFLSFSHELSQKDYSKETNHSFSKVIASYWEHYDAVYPYGEPFPFAVKDVLAQKAEDAIKNALNERGNTLAFGQVFALLESSPKKPFATQEEEALLNMVESVKDHHDVRAFLNGVVSDPVNSLLEDHEKRFFWIPFDYAGDTWTREHFEETVRSMLKPSFDANKRLRDIRAYYDRLPERQAMMENELNLTEADRVVLKTIRIASFLMDYKKECFTKSHFMYRNLVYEVARRLGWSAKEVYAHTPKEVVDALNGKRITKKTGIRILHVNSGVAQLMDGVTASQFMAEQGIVSKTQDEVSELKGTCACGGTVKGTAKVILKAQDLDQLEDGDVLVTVMTTPDFVRGMKKAAAIITNDGGITCHAAIVSREFNIPCIVGTRIATSVFKDGDLLDVRASHGIVRKIQGVI